MLKNKIKFKWITINQEQYFTFLIKDIFHTLNSTWPQYLIVIITLRVISSWSLLKAAVTFTFFPCLPPPLGLPRCPVPWCLSLEDWENNPEGVKYNLWRLKNNPKKGPSSLFPTKRSVFFLGCLRVQARLSGSAGRSTGIGNLAIMRTEEWPWRMRNISE